MGGRLAQLGEHFLDVEGVRSSSLLASTIVRNALVMLHFKGFLFLRFTS